MNVIFNILHFTFYISLLGTYSTTVRARHAVPLQILPLPHIL